MAHDTHLRDQIAALREKLGSFARGRAAEPQTISTGVAALDCLLPRGGLTLGSLVEYLAEGQASGAGLLALAAARSACREGRALAVVDRWRQFYPPVAAAYGLDLAQMLVLHPAQEADEQWALEQVLRSRGVGAVWIACGRLEGRTFRRLQLAAEEGGTLGLLIRPEAVRREPTWAEVQWLVTPQPSAGGWRLGVKLVRCRGGTAGRRVLLEWDESTGFWQEVNDDAARAVHPSAELAPPAAARRA
jgi:protein ImuA